MDCMGETVMGRTQYDEPENLVKDINNALQQGGWSFHRDSSEDFVQIASDLVKQYESGGSPHSREFLLTYDTPNPHGSATLAIEAPAVEENAVLSGEVTYRLDGAGYGPLKDGVREANKAAANVAVQKDETGYLQPVVGEGESPNAAVEIEVPAETFKETDLQSALYSLQTAVETIDEFYAEEAGKQLTQGMKNFTDRF